MKKQYKIIFAILFSMLSVQAFAQLEVFDVVAEPKSNAELPTFKLIFGAGTIVTEKRDTVNQTWKNSGRITGVKDTNKGIQRVLVMDEVDSVTGNFRNILDMRQDITYDGSGKVTAFKKITIANGGLFKTIESGNVTYGTGDQYNPIKGLDSIFQADTLVMAFNSTDSIVYDGSGKMIAREKKRVIMGFDVPVSRKEFVYAGANLFQTIELTEDNGGWMEDKRVTLAYDGSGNITTRLFETYDESNSNWIREELDSFFYNAGKMSMHVSYNHNGTSWEGREYQLFTYTGNNLSELIEKEWNGTSYIDDTKTIFYYTGNQFDSAYAYASNMSGGWGTNPVERIRVSSGPSTGITQLNKVAQKVSIYPNPASESITLNKDMVGADLKIYHINGQLVHTETIENNTVNISHLSSGLYFITLEHEGVSYQSKLSVK